MVGTRRLSDPHLRRDETAPKMGRPLLYGSRYCGGQKESFRDQSRRVYLRNSPRTYSLPNGLCLDANLSTNTFYEETH
jgi:hypothetical protein